MQLKPVIWTPGGWDSRFQRLKPLVALSRLLKFYFEMEFLLYLQTSPLTYRNRDYDASWARAQLIQVLFNPLKAKLLNAH